MGTKRNKSLSADDAKARLAEIARQYESRTANASPEEAAIRESVREAAADEVAAPTPEKPRRGKKAAKPKDATEQGSKIENDEALTSTTETRVGEAGDGPSKPKGGRKALRVPARVAESGGGPPTPPSPPPPTPPDPPGAIQGPPVGPLVADMKERWINSSTPTMSNDVAEKLRKIMSTSRSDAAREAAAAVKSERRASNYPAMLDEIRQRRQAERSIGGPGAAERLQRTNATLIAELRRRTEAARSAANASPKPPPPDPRKPMLPKQYGLIRRLVGGTADRVTPVMKAIPKLVEDAAIVGALGGGIYGLGAAGGLRGVGNYIMSGSTAPQAAGPAAAPQDSPQDGERKSSYGARFKNRAREISSARPQ